MREEYYSYEFLNLFISIIFDSVHRLKKKNRSTRGLAFFFSFFNNVLLFFQNPHIFFQEHYPCPITNIIPAAIAVVFPVVNSSLSVPRLLESRQYRRPNPFSHKEAGTK